MYTRKYPPIPPIQPIDLLLFLGAFDPPHRSHAEVIEHALETIKPKELQIILLNKHIEGKDLAPVADRLTMLKLFCEQFDARVSISTIDIDNNLSGATVETLRCVRASYPKRRLGILLGSDQLKGFCTWQSSTEILEVADCYFIERPGVAADLSLIKDKMYLVPRPTTQVSQQFTQVTSLKIKQLLAAGKAHLPGHYTSDRVLAYILNRNLYAGFFERNPNLRSL